MRRQQLCMLWSSPLFWIVFAVLLFWALGAYNRLMRLRSAVVQSFGSFDAHMVRLVALLGEWDAAIAVQPGRLLAGAREQELAALQGATIQVSVSAISRPGRPAPNSGPHTIAATRITPATTAAATDWSKYCSWAIPVTVAEPRGEIHCT